MEENISYMYIIYHMWKKIDALKYINPETLVASTLHSRWWDLGQVSYSTISYYFSRFTVF